MAGFDIQHTETNGVPDNTLRANMSKISSYRDQLSDVVEGDSYNSPESALLLPDDQKAIKRCQKLVDKLIKNKKPKVVVVVGMGGSVRGTQAVYQLTKKDNTAEMLFLDTINEQAISHVVSQVQSRINSPEDLAVCIVSKSGKTAETIANASMVYEALGKIFSRESLADRLIAITNPNSPLEEKAEDLGLNTIQIPEQVGGRFSVLSAVGCVPLSLAGITVSDLLVGAKKMRQACLSGRPTSDPAAAMASIIKFHLGEGTRILNHFFFTQPARNLGRWVEQLFAESTGKQKDKSGKPVYSGIYPTTTFGPEDLHSLFQLQLGGPKNFFTIFVRESERDQDFLKDISSTLLVDELSYLSGHTYGGLQESLEAAVIEAFRDTGRPFVEISVPSLNEERIGQFIMLEEIAVMYLGHLLEINAFNQPQVEEYKSIMRNKLHS